ncbi:MAG: GreA/GreB family elongation factor [Nibricoccus sp.]
MNRIYISPSDNAKLRAIVITTLYTDENYSAAHALRAELDRAFIRSHDDELSDIITMGATFEYEDLDTGIVAENTLCFPNEVNSTPNGLSVFSPLGIAAIGCAVNDIVDWSTRTNIRRIIIRRVSQPGFRRIAKMRRNPGRSSSKIAAAGSRLANYSTPTTR